MVAVRTKLQVKEQRRFAGSRSHLRQSDNRLHRELALFKVDMGRGRLLKCVDKRNHSGIHFNNIVQQYLIGRNALSVNFLIGAIVDANDSNRLETRPQTNLCSP